MRVTVMWCVALLCVWANAARAQGGLASMYNNCGHKTASGELLQCGALTAAHRTLPFGTMVRVTNIRNGQSVVVRINDRGPFARGRVIDLTPQGQRELRMGGSAPVTLEVVGHY